MSTEKPEVAFREIERQVERLHSVADPATRALATDLVASVLALHASALERMLQILDEATADSPAILAGFDRDDVVRAVLLLHELHPLGTDERVNRAIEHLRPRLERHGAAVSVVRSGADGVVLRIRVESGRCGSTAEELRSIVRAAVVNHAPEASSITIELEGDSGFVPVSSIQSAAPAARADNAAKA